MAIGASEEEVKQEMAKEMEEGVEEGVEIGAVNGRRQVVVTGSEEGLKRMEERMKRRGVMSRRLGVGQAFHSRQLEEVMEEYEREVRKVEMKGIGIPYVTNVRGGWAREGEVKEARYWVRQMREAVRYAEGLEEVMKGGGKVMLEVGPGEQLKGLARRQKREGWQLVVTSVGGGRGEGEERHLRESLGRMWVSGVRVEWEKYYEKEERRRVEMPGYAFQRQRYWIEPLTSKQDSYKLTKQSSDSISHEFINDSSTGLNGKANQLPSSAVPEAKAAKMANPSDHVCAFDARDREGADDELDAIIAQQLQIMAQQIEMLSTECPTEDA